MACHKCGGCCNDVFIKVRADDDAVKWWRLHKMDFQADGGDGKYTMRIKSNCLWYDAPTGECTHYEERPDICKRYLCSLALEG